MATSCEIDCRLERKYSNGYSELAHGLYCHKFTKGEVLTQLEKMIKTETKDKGIIKELLDDAANAYDEFAEHGIYSTPLKYNKIAECVKDTVTEMQQNGEVIEVVESELEKAIREEGILSDLEFKLTESKYAERAVFGKCFITDYKKELIKLSIPTLSDFVMKPLSKRFKLDKKQKISFIKDIIRQKPENERIPTGDEKLDKELGLVKLTPVDVVGIFGNGIDPEFDGLYTESVTSTGRVKITAHIDDIAKRVIETLHVITYKDNVYCYNDGLYINSKEIVRAEAARIINGIYTDVNSSGISRNLNDVMTDIMTHDPQSEYPFQGVMNAINVSNGVIIFQPDGSYKKVDPDPVKYKFNYKLPVKYDSNADSKWIINEINKYSDTPRAILQHIAQAFIQSMGYSPSKLAYMYYGRADGGKSTLFKILKYFMSKKLCCGIALNRMSSDTNNRFALAPLEGKMLNLMDELSYFNLNDVDVFKYVTGTYDIEIEPKGVDSYSAISFAVHGFAANDLPTIDARIRDAEPFWKRIVLIQCNKTTFIRNDKFENILLTEENMSGLLNEVLKVVSEHISGDSWEFSNADGDKWMEVRDEWLRACNPLYKFVLDNMKQGGETYLVKENMLHVLQDWCDEKMLYKAARPDTVNKLTGLVTLCNGSSDERKIFYKYTEEELAEKINGKSKISFGDKDIKEEERCYKIPWTWKETSEYRKKFRPAYIQKK